MRVFGVISRYGIRVRQFQRIDLMLQRNTDASNLTEYQVMEKFTVTGSEITGCGYSSLG